MTISDDFMDENLGYTPEQWEEFDVQFVVGQISQAVADEEEIVQTPLRFKVVQGEQNGANYRVKVVGLDSSWKGYLDEDALKMTKASWSGKPEGSVYIRISIDEEDELDLLKVTHSPPTIGQTIFLRPPNFLKELKKWWEDKEWSRKAYECLKDLSSPKQVDSLVPSKMALQKLQSSQCPALNLVNNSSSFLWGPPGAGKTHTLAVILAEYLSAKPQGRVLLLSSTNFAVDDLILKLDNLLIDIDRHPIRHQLRRYGDGFDREKYEERSHLLPEYTDSLKSSDTSKNTDESSRTYNSENQFFYGNTNTLKPFQADRASAERVTRLYGMTAHGAIQRLEKLQRLGLFDLIVFDESSQISLAHALILMPLGKARLFAGDPRQLTPIAKGQTPEIRQYLAESPFSLIPTADSNWLWQLTEQYRMAPPISDLISELFYGGNLRVADSLRSIPDWLNVRRFEFGPIPESQHIAIVNVDATAYSDSHQPPRTRKASAEMIVRMIVDADMNKLKRDIIVLTPFVAQLKLIKQMLEPHNLNWVRPNTIHRTQGTESLIVIFDPVDGTNGFLNMDSAWRLINVALSRAQAKLVLMFSETDRQNDLLRSISDIVERQRSNSYFSL